MSTTTSSDIVIVGDGNAMLENLRDMLSTAFTVSMVELAQLQRPSRIRARSAICCLLDVPTSLTPGLFAGMGVAPDSVIFAFRTYNKANVDQAKRLGAETVLVAPIERAELMAAVRRAINANVETSWSALRGTEQQALRASLESFDRMFDSIVGGERLPVSEVYTACDRIKGSIEESSIDRWLGALKHHHNSTYRHSMYVCGTIAFFAHSLGIRGEDLRQLTVGGFLHDAGKAHIPLDILDKPGKLEADEWAVMRRHPEHSREILLRESGLTEDIVAMAVHHHEKLDGTGYPDGLNAAQLNDHARLTAIADVYSALVEERAYKPAMLPAEALDKMASFKGHLDLDLVRAFRDFILDRFVIEAVT